MLLDSLLDPVLFELVGLGLLLKVRINNALFFPLLECFYEFKKLKTTPFKIIQGFPWIYVFLKKKEGFPGGPVVKSLPCNAGDTGSTPSSGKILHVINRLSPCTTAIEPVP